MAISGLTGKGSKLTNLPSSNLVEAAQGHFSVTAGDRDGHLGADRDGHLRADRDGHLGADRDGHLGADRDGDQLGPWRSLSNLLEPTQRAECGSLRDDEGEWHRILLLFLGPSMLLA